jgi:hypothetical protein
VAQPTALDLGGANPVSYRFAGDAPVAVRTVNLEGGFIDEEEP